MRDNDKTRREFGMLVAATGVLAAGIGSAQAQPAVQVPENILKFFQACTDPALEEDFVAYVLTDVNGIWTNWNDDKTTFKTEITRPEIGLVLAVENGDGGDNHAKRIYDAIREMNGQPQPPLSQADPPRTAWAQLGNLHAALANTPGDGIFIA